jgi:hypothetical protein
MNTFTWLHTRPKLTIERIGGGAIANCYSGDTWRITSTFRLSKEKIEALYKLGLVGFGQEFGIFSQCDGNELPSGQDLVQCVEITPQGEVLPGVAMNRYSGKPHKPMMFPYFVYACWSKCDSGD